MTTEAVAEVRADLDDQIAQARAYLNVAQHNARMTAAAYEGYIAERGQDPTVLRALRHKRFEAVVAAALKQQALDALYDDRFLATGTVRP